jgi:hypothetical protein
MRWQAFDAIEAEHPGLVSGSRKLLAVLGQSSTMFGVAMLDYRYNDRLIQLQEHLDSAALLAELNRYSDAYTVLRTAMEHVLGDCLLLNASKRRDRYVGASDEWEERQRAAWAAGEAGTEDIHSIERRGKDVLVVRDSYPVAAPDGSIVGHVSPFRVAMDRHSPFIGKKADQGDRWTHVGTIEERRRHADENRLWWESHLSWSAIKEHLELNELYSPRDTRRLDVHYGFLSAFTHAHNDGYRISHQSPPPSTGCHFCHELTMLYIATFAAIEVRAAIAHCSEQRPSFTTPATTFSPWSTRLRPICGSRRVGRAYGTDIVRCCSASSSRSSGRSGSSSRRSSRTTTSRTTGNR